MRPGFRRRPPAPQRGFTLIELMVALVVSSLLVGMIFAIFIRMSVAYRGQQQIAELQNRLAAARAKLEYDAKLAGLGMSQGFQIMSTPNGLHLSPIQIGNSSSSPDSISFYYADTSAQAATVKGSTATCTSQQCDALDSTEGFAVNDLVVAVSPDTTTSPYSGDADITTFDTCVLQIASKTSTSFTFWTNNLWGSGPNAHCTTPPVKGSTVFYKFVAHAWRIDPDRPELGALQLSPTGDLVGANDWQDQAYGFTDLQVATRFYEEGDTLDTPDADTDPEREWYSDGTQDTLTSPHAKLKPPIQIAISLVARTERDVEGVTSASTPNLADSANPANNTIGDHEAVALPSTDPALTGNRVYRYTTFQVDLRNMGVGR